MGHRRLAQADTAVVAGYLVVEKNTKANSLQAGHRQGQQEAVLEAAPA
jgi:hypothetical protein